MTDFYFLGKLKRLEAAFRTHPLSKESSQLYFEQLDDAGVDDATFGQAVEDIIKHDDFFPSINCLLRHCNAEPSYDAAGRILQRI